MDTSADVAPTFGRSPRSNDRICTCPSTVNAQRHHGSAAAEGLRFLVCAASRGEANGSDDMEHALPAVDRSSAGELARRACFCPWRIYMSTVASNLPGAIRTSFLTYY